MQIEDVHRVLVVGAGTMGLQIGLQAASHGYDVWVQDSKAAALEAAPGRLRGYAAEQVAAGVLTEPAADEALGRLTLIADLAAGAGADLVSECVPEDPALKGRVLGELDRLCEARTIVTTNTSMLLPSMLAEPSGRPDRFAALHFHIPVWSANVVDVSPHPGTSEETTELLMAFARRIGQIPILLRRENVGYVFNAIYSGMNREAMTLVANGVASVEDVDRAWMGIMRMPIGPFGMLDLIGIDTVWQITDYWAGITGFPQLRSNADFLRPYVDQGHLGIKTGEGFYRYPDPAFARPGFVEGG